MTLIEVVKSSKRFRRPTWCPDIWYDGQKQFNIFNLSAEDIIADDWIIEEVPVTITSSQYDEISAKVMKKLSDTNHSNTEWVHFATILVVLKKELGL